MGAGWATFQYFRFAAGEAVGVPLAALCSGAHLSGEAAAQDVLAVLDAGCSSCDARADGKARLREALENASSMTHAT